MEKDSLAFYELVGKLKSLPRAGWVRRGIPNPEIVAEHMYRSQFIAYDLAVELGADPQRCSNMMMVHDLPEALAGDITPHCGVSKEEKARKEIEAAVYLAGLSGNNDYFELFMEYERKETLCAQICNDADKLECLVQALEYAKQYPTKAKVLEDFWPYSQGKLMTEPGKRMFAKLVTRKQNLPRTFGRTPS